MTGVRRRKDSDRNCPDLLVLFSLVHYRLWERLAVCSCIKRPHRPPAQIVYYITVGFPPLTKHSPHNLSVPLTTNSSVSSLTGSCEWMMNYLRTKCCRPTQSHCWNKFSADMFTLQSRTLPRPKSADKWSLHGTEMPRRCVLDCEIDGQRVGGWLKSRNSRWWSVGTWLGGFIANCLQAGEFNPAGKAQSCSAVTIRKLWGHFMSMSIRATQPLQYKAPKAVLRLSTTGVFKLIEAMTPLFDRKNNWNTV